MVKIRKKSSKRVGYREKYSVLKKVANHHRRMRKTARKLGQAGIRPRPSKQKMVIPNSFPGKEELINEMEEQRRMEMEKQKSKIDNRKAADSKFDDDQNVQFEQVLHAPLVKEEVNDKYAGLTEQEIKEAEALMDPEGVLKQANISKKAHWRDIKKVVENADVIVYVLDARDPIGTLNLEVDELIHTNAKKLIYVLNKTDLVPPENVKAWIAKFKKEKSLCLPFQANLTVFNKGEEADEIQTKNGSEKLMSVLFKYYQKFAEKKQQEFISVGVVGMQNVGKSSLINVLRNKPVCATGGSSFTTRGLQEVKLNSHVFIVDTPCIMLQKVEGSSSLQQIRSAVLVDDLPNPVALVDEIVSKLEKDEILRHYRIANFKDTNEMLELIATKKGLTTQVQDEQKKGKKKKHVPNKEEAARRMIRDFLNNRLRYFSKL